MQLDEEAVLPGDPVALGYLRELCGKFGDLGQAARHGSDPGECGHGQADGGRVDVQAVASDDARLSPDGRRPA
jgi:hypothetical protein